MCHVCVSVWVYVSDIKVNFHVFFKGLLFYLFPFSFLFPTSTIHPSLILLGPVFPYIYVFYPPGLHSHPHGILLISWTLWALQLKHIYGDLTPISTVTENDMWCLSSLFWVACLKMTVSRSFNLVMSSVVSFFSVSLSNITQYDSNNFHSSVDANLDSFHFLSIVDIITMNIG